MPAPAPDSSGPKIQFKVQRVEGESDKPSLAVRLMSFALSLLHGWLVAIIVTAAVGYETRMWSVTIAVGVIFLIAHSMMVRMSMQARAINTLWDMAQEEKMAQLQSSLEDMFSKMGMSPKESAPPKSKPDPLTPPTPDWN